MQRDSEERTSGLAERCGLSRWACGRRIARQTEAGVIERSVPLLSQSKLVLGLTVLIAIKTNQHNAARSSQFQHAVKQLLGILEARRLGGHIEYLVKAVVFEMLGYDALYQQLDQGRSLCGQRELCYVNHETHHRTALVTT